MTSAKTSWRAGGSRTLVYLFCGLLTLTWQRPGAAVEASWIPASPASGAEAWLVTFGPGKLYWERFGHNAIWLREPASGLDHTFNFGYFDFDQENFFGRFIRGRMEYFSVAQAGARELEYYRRDGRNIRLQKLNLDHRQYSRLRDHLLHAISPENRNYPYDYYLDNCSTRIRDALDSALGGALRERTRGAPATLNFRDHTRRLTQQDFWYYLGLELALGSPVDRPISRWEEMFIPMVVADELAASSLALEGRGQRPWLSRDTQLFAPGSAGTAAAPGAAWPRYLLLALLVLGLAWLSSRRMPPVWPAGLSAAWILLNATAGALLAALWLFTDHEAARNNANLLLLNPLFLVALATPLRRPGAALLAGATLAACLSPLLPAHQYNLDALALLAPVNLAVAARLAGTRSAGSGRPRPL